MKKTSKSHKDKFTGIYDMNGVPIHNGDKVRVHDNNSFRKEEIIGTVIWKNGSYEFKGENKNSCKYNIYAWRSRVEVLESDRPSIYELANVDEMLDKFEHKNFRLIADKDELLKHYRLQVKEAYKEAYKLGLEHKALQNEG